MAETVTVVREADNALYRIPAANLEQVLAQGGYRQEAAEETRTRELEDEYGGVIGALQAGAAGLGRGLTMGLSDVALTATGLVEPETLQALQEVQPAAGIAGELVGTALPFLATGGTSAVAKGAAAAVKGLGAPVRGSVAAGEAVTKALLGESSEQLAKTLAKAAGGATEGLIAAGGQLLSEDAINGGDQDLTTEQITATLGASFLLGGAVGPIASKLGDFGTDTAEAIAATTRKAIPRDLQTTFKEISEDTGMKAIGMGKKFWKQLARENKIEGAADDLLNVKHPDGKGILRTGADHESIAQRLDDTVDHYGKKTGEFLKELDQIVDQTPPDLLDGDDLLRPMRIAQRIRKEILEPLEGLPTARDLRARLEKEAAAFEEVGDINWTFATAQATRENIRPRLKLGGDPTPMQAKLRDIDQILREEMERSADLVAEKRLKKGAFQEYKDAKRIYRNLVTLRDGARDRVLANRTNRRPSLTDYGTGLTGALAGAMDADGLVASIAQGGVTGGVIAYGHKLVRERGNTVISRLAAKGSEMQSIARLSEKLNKAVDTGLKGFVAAPGTAARIAPIGATQILSKSMFGEQRRRAREESREASKVAAYRERFQEIAEIVTNPNIGAARATAKLTGLDTIAPGISSKLALKSSQIAAYLYAKAPKSPRPPDVMSKRQWQPTGHAIDEWARRVEIAENPQRVIDHLRGGTLTLAHAETLRELYPRMYGKVIMRLTEQIAELPEGVPYRQRVMLSNLFGYPLDDTAMPQFVQAMQQLSEEAKQQQEQQQRTPSRVVGIRNTTLAERSQTRAQRIEG